MTKSMIAIAMLATLATPVPVAAKSVPTISQTTKQADGVRWCLSSDREEKVWCLGYVLGMAQGLKAWEVVSKDTAKICIPEKIEANKLRAVIIDYYNKGNKDVRSYDLDDLTLFAFEEIWPCAGSGTKEKIS